MSVRKEWNGEARKAELHATMARRILACAIVVQNAAKRLLSVAGTGKPGRDHKGKFKRAYGSNPSAPGEPPHKQHGRLRMSVTYAAEGLMARIGTNLLYGRLLELGTRKMAARPWLRRALKESIGAIRAILGKPIN